MRSRGLADNFVEWTGETCEGVKATCQCGKVIFGTAANARNLAVHVVSRQHKRFKGEQLGGKQKVIGNFFPSKRAEDIEKASLIVKARRLAVAANSNAVAPSCLQGRVARGQPLPRVALMPLPDGQTDGEEEEGQRDEGRRLRSLMAFMCGLGREAMPRDVFRVVVDLLMPSGDPLRRKRAGTARPPK